MISRENAEPDLNHCARENAAGPIIAVTVIFALAYALFRDHVAGTVPWNDVSLHTLNSGIALGAMVLLTFGFSFKPLFNLGAPLPARWLNARKALGMTGFLLALIHALVGFLLFNPNVYGGLFRPDGTMTSPAWISMLCGILAIVMLAAFNLSFQTFLREDRRFDRLLASRNFFQVALLLSMAHLAVLELHEWLGPGDWQGGLPPVSLLAFVLPALGIAANLLHEKQAR